MSTTNKNENPLRQIRQLNDEVAWADYNDATLFTQLCTLTPNRDEEKLVASTIHSEVDWKKKGVVYVMVLDGRILKIGQSIGTFHSRLGSYNSGKMAYRSRGTNSGANFFILQSILNLEKNIEVFAFFPEHKEWKILNKKGKEAFPSAKVVEGIIIQRFKGTYGKLPIGNSQN